MGEYIDIHYTSNKFFIAISYRIFRHQTRVIHENVDNTQIGIDLLFDFFDALRISDINLNCAFLNPLRRVVSFAKFCQFHAITLYACALTPRCLSSVHSSLPASKSISKQAILQPQRANSMQISRPIPLLPPVT